MKTFFELIKIKHWVKNFFIFAPIVFALQLFHLDKLLTVIATFFAFSFSAVFIYIFNDIKDKNMDSIHPEKSKRPIASGKIDTKIAMLIGIIFLITGLIISLFIGFFTTLIILIYVIMNILYTFYLKNIVILDVFIIAIGFCLRVLAGSVAINVELSNWMILATFSISLIIGFGKRRHELDILGNDASSHRKNLFEYNKEFLDMLIGIATSITALSYALYTMDNEVIAKLGTDKLIFTFPFVLYGLYRYLLLVYFKKKGGNPEELVVTDVGIILSVILWIIAVVVLVYLKNDIHNLFINFNLFTYLKK
jgi:decaprenyl-phosphate phosphoribosyltransferase